MLTMQYRIAVIAFPLVSLATELDCAATTETISNTVIMVSGGALDLFTFMQAKSEAGLGKH